MNMTGAGGGPDAVIDRAEKELSDGARVHLEPGLINVTSRETGIVSVHECAHGSILTSKR